MDEALIEPSSPPERRAQERPARHDERRRYYRLTEFGREVLEAEARRLEALVFEARQRHVLGRTSRA